MGLKDTIIELIDNTFPWLIRDPSIYAGDKNPYQLTSEDYERLQQLRSRDAKYLGNMACEAEKCVPQQDN